MLTALINAEKNKDHVYTNKALAPKTCRKTMKYARGLVSRGLIKCDGQEAGKRLIDI